MEMGMAASLMKAICLSKISGGSWSKPTINPPSLPSRATVCVERTPKDRLHVLHFARRPIAFHGRGFDPDEHLVEAGCVHQGEQFVVFRPRLIDAWVNREKGLPRPAHPIDDPGKERLDGRPVPTKLSSTTNTDPAIPSDRAASSSSRTCSAVWCGEFVPKSSMTSRRTRTRTGTPGILDWHRAVPSQPAQGVDRGEELWSCPPARRLRMAAAHCPLQDRETSSR